MSTQGRSTSHSNASVFFAAESFASLVCREQAAVAIQRTWRRARYGLTHSTRRESWKTWVYDLFESDTKGFASFVRSTIVVSIVISVSSTVVETMPELWGLYSAWHLFALEVSCTLIFSLEYSLRFWSSDLDGSRVAFSLQVTNIMDMLSLLPLYMDAVLVIFMVQGPASSPVRFLRLFRLLRVSRLFKLGRHSDGLRLMFSAITQSLEATLVIWYCVILGATIFASFIYYFERASCEDWREAPVSEQDSMRRRMELRRCPNDPGAGWSPYGLCCDIYGSPLSFTSFSSTFWYCCVTAFTVGYGDSFPFTKQGRLLSVALMIAGILVVTMPIAIVGRKFQKAFERASLEEIARQHLRVDRKPRTTRAAILSTASVVRDKLRKLAFHGIFPSVAGVPAKLRKVKMQHTRKHQVHNKTIELRTMRINDPECRRMSAKLSKLMGEYQDIVDDSLQVHRSLQEDYGKLLKGIARIEPDLTS